MTELSTLDVRMRIGHERRLRELIESRRLMPWEMRGHVIRFVDRETLCDGVIIVTEDNHYFCTELVNYESQGPYLSDFEHDVPLADLVKLGVVSLEEVQAIVDP